MLLQDIIIIRQRILKIFRLIIEGLVSPAQCNGLDTVYDVAVEWIVKIRKADEDRIRL